MIANKNQTKKKCSKVYTSNWSEEIFVIKRIKNIAPSTYMIKCLNGEETVGTFHEQELQKANLCGLKLINANDIV